MSGITEGSANIAIKKYKKKSQWILIWKRMKRNKIAMVGVGIFLVIVFLTIFADFIVSYEAALEQKIENRLQPPSAQNWFGTDAYGRDIFARIIHGTRTSFMMGIGAVVVGIVIGGIIGASAGYYRGKIDSFIMWIMDLNLCIPFILMALAIVAVLGSGLINLFIALVVSYVPIYARVIRSAILTVVDQDFIEAAKACGTPDHLIILKHILPNAIGTVIVQATMSVGSMIISAASLSFLGMGIQPPTPEWGSMLSEGKDYMLYAPHIVMFPGMTIMLVVFAFNLMGDGLRDALDPKLKD